MKRFCFEVYELKICFHVFGTDVARTWQEPKGSTQKRQTGEIQKDFKGSQNQNDPSEKNKKIENMN